MLKRKSKLTKSETICHLHEFAAHYIVKRRLALTTCCVNCFCPLENPWLNQNSLILCHKLWETNWPFQCSIWCLLRIWIWSLFVWLTAICALFTNKEEEGIFLLRTPRIGHVRNPSKDACYIVIMPTTFNLSSLFWFYCIKTNCTKPRFIGILKNYSFGSIVLFFLILHHFTCSPPKFTQP